MNLAINSRDAMLMGGTVTIEIQAVTVDEPSARRESPPEIAPGKYVVLKVTDTGSGISKDVLDKVFADVGEHLVSRLLCAVCLLCLRSPASHPPAPADL